MAFYFTCSNSICGRQLKVRDDLEGRLIACPRCGTNQVAVAEGRVAEDLVRADAAAQARDGKLRSHVFLSYTHLRIGMGVLALVFPLMLLVGGCALSEPLQGSLSAYYYTLVRNFFVGILFALGAFLYLYKGFSWQENYALNVAGVLAILIAVVPTDPMPGVLAILIAVAPTDQTPNVLSWMPWFHYLFAALFFLVIAYVCIFRAADTTPFIASSARSKFYSRTYKLLGICIIVVPGAVCFLVKCYPRVPFLQPYNTLFMEWVAIWVFSAYWLLKSKEIRDSQADQRAPVREKDRIRVERPRREENRAIKVSGV